MTSTSSGVQLQRALQPVPGKTQLRIAIHVAVALLAALSAFFGLGLTLYQPDDSHVAITLWSSLTILTLILSCRYLLRLPWLSASVVYLILFWLFHCGMTFTAALFPDTLAAFEDEQLDWLDFPNVRIAAVLAIIGAAGFAFGVGLFGPRPEAGQQRAVTNRRDAGLYLGGWLLMLPAIAASIVIVAQNEGLNIFSMGYLSFLALMSSTWLGTTLSLSNLGCLFAVCGAGGGRWVKPIVVWGSFIGVPVMVLGSRATAMVPIVSFAVVLTQLGVKLRRGVVVAGVLIAMFAIPAVNAFRSVGFGNRSSVAWTEIAPLDTLMELGATLRATKAYVDWIEQGDEHLLGASYWAPFDRQVLTYVLPDRERLPLSQDERVPGRLMLEREGAVGASATGEAYYNFGPIGPFIYFSVLGGLLGWLERRGVATPYRSAFLGIVVSLLYFNIRGDWLAIPAQMAGGLILLACCYLLGRFVLGSTPVLSDHSPSRAALRV